MAKINDQRTMRATTFRPRQTWPGPLLLDHETILNHISSVLAAQVPPSSTWQ